MILQQLKIHDPVVANKFHPNDTRRIRRALEVFYTTGQRTSDLYEKQKVNGNTNVEENSIGSLDSRFHTLVFWIWCDQPTLNTRLDDRVDLMIKNGLYDEIDEMYSIFKSNPDQEDLKHGVWQVIGFRQFLPWLKDNKQDPKKLEQCIEEMKRDTRRYSKQQTKFMKNTLMPKINTIIEKHKTKKDNNNNEHDNGIVVTLLDATDLSKWDENVKVKGLKIAQEFLSKQLNDTVLIPRNEDRQNEDTEEYERLKKLLVSSKSFDKSQWETFSCSVCTSPNKQTGEQEPFTAVGKENWLKHLKSRKHKGTLSKLAKHERNEREKAKRRKVQEDTEIKTD